MLRRCIFFKSLSDLGRSTQKIQKDVGSLAWQACGFPTYDSWLSRFFWTCYNTGKIKWMTQNDPTCWLNDQPFMAPKWYASFDRPLRRHLVLQLQWAGGILKCLLNYGSHGVPTLGEVGDTPQLHIRVQACCVCAPGQMKPWIFRGDSGVLTTMLLAHIWCSHADMYLNSRRLSAVKHLDGSSEAAIGYPTPEVREDRITSFASRATMCRDLSLPRCVSDVKQSRWDSANTLCTCTFRTHMYMFLHASWAWRNANRLFDSQNNAASGAWHWLGERKNWDMWASRIV